MRKPSEKTPNRQLLRLAAERRLEAGLAESSPLDEKKLLHELQVHQIELEMQNEALREAQSTAESAQRRYAELFDFAPLAYFSLGPDSVIHESNFRAEGLLGKERGRLAGQALSGFIHCNDRTQFNDFLRQVFAADAPQNAEFSLQGRDDPLYVAMEACVDAERRLCLAALQDISERKRNEQALQLAATVYLSLGEAVMVVDAGNRIVAINPAFTTLTGYSEAEALGQSSSLLKSGMHGKAFYEDMWAWLNTTGRWQGEIWNRRKNGVMFLEWLVISTVFGENGEVLRRVGMFSDITDKKRAEEIMRKQANIDPLTELPNRRLFLDRLQRAILKSQRAGQQLALLFLDLDHFKDINDTLGHHTGDSLLQEAARRLKRCIRETDTLARPGGDEFTIILGELDELNTIERVANCILNTMSAPFHLGDQNCYISISIGITVYPDDSIQTDDLLKNADQAMYAAKHQGRNCFCYFTPAMQQQAENRMRLTNDLRGALAAGEFHLVFQPIVALTGGRIRKAEALIRWLHPERGLISPADFIPIAEDTGLIIDIGEWVFRQAAEQARRWRRQLDPAFQISVNKSPTQFHNRDEGHNDWFEQLQALGLPGDAIVVEITEGLLLDASPLVAEKLQAFRAAGMQVSLDDFGTGYSALSYLKKFEIDYLKIDRSFVSHLSPGCTDMALCEAIILMAHKLGMQVIAEGIETELQRDLLLQAGCDFGQGYLFSRPVSAAEFEGLFL